MQTNVVSITAPVESLPELAEPGPASESVGARAGLAVKVPSWFTSGAALRVAQLKGVSHLLVLDRGAVVGTVAARVLALAPIWRPLAQLMVTTIASVAADASVDEARALMGSLDLECLPVTSGPLLVGLVTRAQLAEHPLLAAG
jgi:CBS domain-containing protein